MMSFDYNSYKEEVLIQIRKRIKIFSIIFILISIIFPLLFFFITAYETHKLGLELLGHERYSERMNDSYTFTFIMFIVLFMFIALPGIFIMKKFLNKYMIVVKSLSTKDLFTYKTINDQLSFIEKHMPSFIIKDHSVIFFQLFRQTQIDFREMKSIDITRTYGKYAGFVFKIKTTHQKYRFKISTNLLQMETLVAQATLSNPYLPITKS